MPARVSLAASRNSLWLVCGVAYLLIGVLYWPSVQLASISLDDASQLQEVSQQPFSSVFERDRFGHLRPIKSAVFWLLSRHVEWLPLWRMGLLGMVVVSAMLWQSLCRPRLHSGRWALATAVCWAVNPITVSVLCWLSAANIAIGLLGMLGYLWFLQRALAAGAGRRTLVVCSIAGIASLLVAVLSHELALLAPVLWFVQRRSVSGSITSRRHVGMLAAASAVCIAVWLSLLAVSEARSIDYRFADQPRGQLVWSAARYLFENLRLWLWLPGRFGVLLADDPAKHGLANAIAWLAVGAAGVLLSRLRGRDSTLSFAALWCAVLLVPLLNLVPIGNTPVALHYLYMPGMGLALLITRAAQLLTERLGRRARWMPAWALAVLIAAWLPEQRSAMAAWADAQTLYERTITNYPRNLEARVNLAAVYLDHKQYREAEALLVDSLRLAPREFGLLANRFDLLANTGRAAEALALLDEHPELKTSVSWLQRGTLLAHVDRNPEAVDAFSQAFAIATQSEERFASGYQLAIALAREQHYVEAEALIDRLLVEFPQRPELLFSKRLLSERR